ncbi:hypothetical protein [Paenarthrobacter nitroguajacolicus]|uniref:hypothetical protein n=1 Tax=Paenarthrobacter nitroguajacolicus TaxID=211146 RepID=UPI0028633474|nr:hypothetical protein [Paenarthrobacter nitroguajacolicus]MDR6638550.1 hypothetical protein [Paenarthrobacter nitroguajacolicus]
MASWRESVDQTAQDDVDSLLSEALPFAVRCLTAYGELYPFAAAIKDDGEHVYLATETMLSDQHLPAQSVIAECYEALAAQREDLRAAVVVSDVRLAGLGGDAMHFALEHLAGFALGLVQPYLLIPGRDVSLGRMSLVAGDRVTWPESAA